MARYAQERRATSVDDAASRQTLADASLDEVSVFRYDTLGQLTAADHTFERNEAYSYDANGNRTNSGYTTTAGNRLSTDGKFNYTYDNEGNRLTKTDIATGDKEEYEWDHRNRLVSVTFKNPAGTVVRKVGYQYDAFDRLVWRADDKTSPFTYADAPAEWFVYDGDDVILSLWDANGGASTDAVVAKRYLHGPAVDQVLAQEDGDGTDVLW